uniref:Uncharacterized protein n=1 Tax=Hordeum vulgare subsp. vulgare TaxID=112509 RepID=A0A8I6X825_HORVV
MEAILQRLLGTDWLRGCSSRRFCYQCERPVCSHCCSEHGLHHRRGPPPALVADVHGMTALRAEDTVGCGYCLNGIQRLRARGTNWIAVIPPPNDIRRGNDCAWCGRTTKTGSTHCSMQCRRVHVPSGTGRRMVQRLIGSLPQLGQPIHLPDRLCMFCRQVFGSSSCPDHFAHHGEHRDAAAALGLMAVRHLDGWPLVSAAQLPQGFGEGVQVQNIDGQAYHPIHQRPLHLDGVDRDAAAHPCARLGCWEVTGDGDAEFCSLRCGRQ